MEEYKQHMAKGREAFVAQDYRKAYEFFNAALDLIKNLESGGDQSKVYYVTQECVFDALEKMQDYKMALQRIEEVIKEEQAKGDSAPIKHIAHFMQRKACLEIKSGNNRPGVKLAGEAYDLSFKTKEQTNVEIAAKIYNEHQRGTKITVDYLEYWQKHHNYWVADKEPAL
jgi:tetratricopeptide (TPR) repeat protein